MKIRNLFETDLELQDEQDLGACGLLQFNISLNDLHNVFKIAMVVYPFSLVCCYLIQCYFAQYPVSLSSFISEVIF